MGAGILSPALFVMQEIPLCDISEITTKRPYDAALMGERQARRTSVFRHARFCPVSGVRGI